METKISKKYLELLKSQKVRTWGVGLYSADADTFLFTSDSFNSTKVFFFNNIYGAEYLIEEILDNHKLLSNVYAYRIICWVDKNELYDIYEKYKVYVTVDIDNDNIDEIDFINPMMIKTRA